MIKWRAVLAASVGMGLAAGCGIAAAAETSGCKLAKAADWPVRMERNLLIVDGAINGQPIRVMLDTGASRTLIMRAAATRLELAREPSRNYRMFGVGGETKVEIAFVDEFKVGEIVRTKLRMLVAGDRDFGADVLLGEDFLQRVDIEFDLAQKAVRLFQPQNCDGVSLAYWANTGFGEVEMEAVNAARPQVLLTVLINGQPIKALLDSGASRSVLEKSEAARLGVTPETPGVVASSRNSGLGSKTPPSWIGPFQSFTIGNETIRNTEIRFADIFKDVTYSVIGSHLPVKAEGLVSMLLGVDFLRSHRVLVAHSQRRIYFTYNGGSVFQVNPPPAQRNDPRPTDDAKPGTVEK